MVSPEESSESNKFADKKSLNKSVVPHHEVSDGVIPGNLRKEALSTLAGERAQNLFDVLQRETNVPSPESKSQQFLDLRHEVEVLLARPTGSHAMQILDHLARRHITHVSTVLAAAAMLNRLYDWGVNERHTDTLSRLVTMNNAGRNERDAALQDLCRLVTLSAREWKGGLPAERLLDVLRRSHVIAQEVQLPPARRECFLKILGDLASYQGHFRGVQVIRRCLEDAGPGLDNLLVTVLNGALSVGDSPKFVIRAFKEILPLLEKSEEARCALRAAVADQVIQDASVEALIRSFSGIVASYPEANQPSALNSYSRLIEKLRPHDVALHHLRREHVERFNQANPTTYSLLLARHMADVVEVLAIARAARCYSDESLKALHTVLSPNQSREMVGFFRKFFTEIASDCEAPHAALRALTKMSISLVGQPSAWASIDTLLEAQVANGRPCDGLVKGMSSVIEYSQKVLKSLELWNKWMVLAHNLSDQIPDFSFLNREAAEWFFLEPTEQRFHDLVVLLDCADQLLPHFPQNTDPASVTTGLLRRDGPGSALVRAFVAHKRNGYSTDSLLVNYRALEQKLVPPGLAVLRRIVNYHIEKKFPLDGVFGNFAEMAEYTQTYFPDHGVNEVWQAMSELVQKLMQKSVPLDYLGIAAFEEYVTAADGDKALQRIEQYLETWYRLSTNPDIKADNQAAQKFLAAVAALGPASPAGKVLEMLTTSDDGSGEILDLPTIAGLFGGNIERISPEAWIAIGRSIEAYRAKRYELTRLVKDIIAIDREIADLKVDVREVWKSGMEVLFELREAELPYDLISGELIKRFHDAGEEPQALLSHFIRGMSRFSEHLARMGQPDPREALRKTLNAITSQSFGLTDNPAMVHKLNLILAEGRISSIPEFFVKLRDLKMHALTDIMRNATDEARKKWARELMAREFNMGGPPYEEGSVAARRHFNQTMEVVDRALRDSKGFGGLALDSRGVPRSDELEAVPPMLMRFGIHSARQTFILNSSDNQSFPGKGCVIQGVRCDRVFSADPHWRQNKKSSPYWRWTEGDGLFNNQYFHDFDMDYFERSAFVFMRGLKIVIPPASLECILDQEPYSYLVYNRHFYPGPEVALLVPTVVVRELLGSSLIQADDYRGFDQHRTDISQIDFSYQNLLARCQARGLNLLDLTYGSVIGGGLCNAYLPKSLPHYDWERGVDSSYGWTDSWGHVHKSFRLGSYGRMGRTLDESLQSARRLHSWVYDVARPLQDYLSAFGFAFSFYKMGSTLIGETDFREPNQDPGREQEGEENEREDDGQEEELSFEDRLERDNPPVHEYRYRMLEETYRWYLGATEQGWHRDQFPILHFAWVLDPNSLPGASQKKFEIDVATMILKTPEGSFQLPKDGNGFGEEERELWRKYVVPFFESDSTGWEPRFLLRDGAFQIHE